MIKSENVVEDADYIKMRNDLIPFAEKYANEKNGRFGPRGTGQIEAVYNWGEVWNKDFHAEMNRLAKIHLK